MTTVSPPPGGDTPSVAVMTNTGAGERATFLSADGAPVLELLLELGPSHHGPPPHIHPEAEESFTVAQGTLHLLIGRRWQPFETGQGATVRPGTRHTYRGLPGAPARALVRITPGAPMRAFLTDLYGLAANDRVDAEGSPRLRDAAKLFQEHPGAMSLAGVPGWVQGPLWRALSRGAA